MTSDQPRLCVGCGFCCWKVPCELAVRQLELLTVERPCPELTFRDGRHWCGIILKAEGSRAALLSSELYLGGGCCCGLNTWRLEPIVDRTQNFEQ